MLKEVWSQAGLPGHLSFSNSGVLRLQLRQYMTSCPRHLPSPAPYKTNVLHGNCAEVNNLLTSGRAWPRLMTLSER